MRLPDVTTISPFVTLVLAATTSFGQPPPPDLAALVTRDGSGGRVMAWCRGEFRPDRPGAYAVAIANAHGSQYVVLDAHGTSTVLGAFSGGADLACYSPAAAAALSVSIRRSTTIQGRIAPRWKTSVVCGFIDNTTARCWQFSPSARAFVRVGGWVT